MTDTRLRDLLHEAVGETPGPDLADRSWELARRRRRATRATGLVASAVAVVVVAVGVVGVTTRDRGPGPVAPPTTAPSQATYGADRADAAYGGRPVWWAPRYAQESSLPAYADSPLPARLDVRSSAPPLATHPLKWAVAAFGVPYVGSTPERPYRVLVLGPQGELRTVDVSRVAPAADPEANPRLAIGPSMLSPSGEYLMFPQDRGILVLTLMTGRWHLVHTGRLSTWNATWASDRLLVVPDPAHPRSAAPVFSLGGAQRGSSFLLATGIPDVPLGSSRPYGRVRTGQAGAAQAFYAGAPIRQPPSLHLAPGQSDWIAVNGGLSAILLVPGDTARMKECCRVDGWIGPDTLLYESDSARGQRVIAWDVGSHRFWNVMDIYGQPRFSGVVVTSFARLWQSGTVRTD